MCSGLGLGVARDIPVVSVVAFIGCAYYGIKNRRAAKAEDAAADEGDNTDNGDVSGDSEA